MSVIDVLLTISPALEKGQALSQADTWNNAVTAKLAIVTVIGSVLTIAKIFGYDIPISDEQISQLGGAVASIGGAVVLFVRFAGNPNRGITRNNSSLT